MRRILLALALFTLGGALPAAEAKAAPKGGTKGEAAVKKNAKVDAAELMKKFDCLACHSVKKKVVGPAFVDVAKKYKGDKKAVETLVKKVKVGGSGNWGAVPMSPHPDLSDEDAEVLVKWVLTRR